MRAAPADSVRRTLSPDGDSPLSSSPGDLDGGGAVADVDQTKPALLVRVLSGIERRHPVTHGAFVFLSRHLVDAGQKSVGGSNVRPGLDVQVRGQVQPPVAVAASGTSGEALLGVPVFKVHGVEMPGLFRVQRQVHGTEGVSVIVECVDTHPPDTIGTVDHPQESLLRHVVGGHDQRNGVRRRQRLAEICHMERGLVDHSHVVARRCIARRYSPIGDVRIREVGGSVACSSRWKRTTSRFASGSRRCTVHDHRGTTGSRWYPDRGSRPDCGRVRARRCRSRRSARRR